MPRTKKAESQPNLKVSGVEIRDAKAVAVHGLTMEVYLAPPAGRKILLATSTGEISLSKSEALVLFYWLDSVLARKG